MLLLRSTRRLVRQLEEIFLPAEVKDLMTLKTKLIVGLKYLSSLQFACRSVAEILNTTLNHLNIRIPLYTEQWLPNQSI